MIEARVEDIAATLEEIKPLLPAHWRELGLFQDRMPLDPIYELYLARAAAGEGLLVTLRRGPKLIGYFVGFIAPGLHYRQTLTCTMDLIYITPEERGLKSSRLLLDTVRAELRRRDVRLWWVGSKNHKPIEAVFEAYGFERAETYFTLWLED